MKMYTHDGQAVEVIKKIEDGYLAKRIYESYDSQFEDEEEEEDPEYSLGEEVIFFAELFEKPQTISYAQEVKKLEADAVKLREDIADLQEQKRSEAGLLNKIAKFPFIQKLVEYVTGDFEYIVHLRNFELSTKGSIYNGPYVKVVNTKDEGWGLYKLYHDTYASNDDRPIVCFKTLDEANAYVKEAILSKISNWKAGSWNHTSSFKEWFAKIHYNQKMREHPSVVEAYGLKLDELSGLEKQEQKASLEKQLQELEAKKKALETKTA